jgi:predicted esterase
MPAAPTLDVREIAVEGDRSFGTKALVLTPSKASRERPFPILVLLHGLAETENPKLGIHAWADRYGLVASDARLRAPPVTASEARRYLPPERLDRINRDLARAAYRGFVVVCPYTPNVYKMPPTGAALDRYSAWIERALLPAVRASGVARSDAAGTAIDGCSLGGYMALEVFLRAPQLFGAVGGVQTAISERYAPAYGDRIRAAIDKAGPRKIHIESSLWDPSKKAHELLSARLDELHVSHDFDVLPGGHDQIFLREVGTLEMLLWHDRQMAR